MEKTFHKHIAHGHFSQGPSWLKNIKMKRIHTQKQLRTGALNTLILLIALAWSAALHGEGTRQVAPTGPGDIVMLETNSPDFGNFATFNGPEDSRLYITINDPGEVVYLGLSAEFSDLGSPFGLLSYSQYRFRIKKVVQGGPDPIVHGPFTISNTNANVNSWNQAQYGSYSVTATNSAGQLIYQFAPGSAGDYYIEFADFTSDNDPKVMIGYWDITVTSGETPSTAVSGQGTGPSAPPGLPAIFTRNAVGTGRSTAPFIPIRRTDSFPKSIFRIPDSRGCPSTWLSPARGPAPPAT